MLFAAEGFGAPGRPRAWRTGRSCSARRSRCHRLRQPHLYGRTGLAVQEVRRCHLKALVRPAGFADASRWLWGVDIPADGGMFAHLQATRYGL